MRMSVHVPVQENRRNGSNARFDSSRKPPSFHEGGPMPYPHYHRKRKKNSSQTILNNVIADYNPLRGAWLIEMALMFNWEKPLATNRWSEIFECHQFCSLTGLPFFPDVDDDEDEFFKKRPTSALCTNLLKNQLEELQSKKIPPQLPLFNNINMLSKMLW